MLSRNSTLFKVYKNTIKMMTRRGYTISPEILAMSANAAVMQANISLDYVRANKTTLQDFMIQKGRRRERNMLSCILTSEQKTCLLYFADTDNAKNISKDETILIGDICIEFNCNVIVMISPTKLGNISTSELQGLESTKNIQVQIFFDDDMMYDPIANQFGGKYELLSEEEEINLLKKNRLTKSQFPRCSDIIPYYYGIKPGRIMKVTRKILVPNTSINEEITYRLVQARSQEKPKTTKKN